MATAWTKREVTNIGAPLVSGTAYLTVHRYWIGTKICPRERRPGVPAQLMSKRRKTIARELARGMALHVKSDLTEEWEYNADHAQMDADHKKTAKGPKPKSGKRRRLLERIFQLILKDRRGSCGTRGCPTRSSASAGRPSTTG